MMKWPRMRFRLTHLMAAVAIAGLALSSFRCVDELRYSTLSYGRNTSVLPIGLQVRIVEDVPSFEGAKIPAGTTGVVTSDPPDEDSAHPDRLVGAKLSNRPGSGTVVNVKRTSLRAD